MSVTRPGEFLLVCEQCGKAYRLLPLPRHCVARCIRCEATLGRSHRLSLSTLLALTVTAAAVFLFGISTDVLSLDMRGTVEGASLPQAIVATWNEGQQLVALVAATTALLAPALFIALRLYVLVPLSVGRVPRGFAFCVRLLHQTGRWNMVEVFTIGTLLSLVRLSSLADASPGPGLFALGLVTLLFAAIESAGLKHLWWQV
ncbi:MAG: paraquat-inducible protein A [Pseudomonadota bacterium]|nr:paraquat-inducible protein A [Pseudomonadota bacterium]